ncbi:hypothetical protein LCGC14_0534100 [marine sediment metagenome]|uniref:Uncharacterized protein n=1 Tax=marine sediment metagenome TaxID=412755 RepID=A0A0F9UG47_9ZZZZ
MAFGPHADAEHDLRGYTGKVCCSDMVHEMYKSIPQWKCGNPPTAVPKQEDINTGNEIEDMKRFHMAVSDFRVRSYAWMVCTTNFIHKYPRAIDYWGRSLIKKHPHTGEVVQ